MTATDEIPTTEPAPDTPARAVAIVSGGLDSTVLAYWLASQGFDLHMVSFDYGQRHAKELTYAARTAEKLGADDTVVDLSEFGKVIPTSALTGAVPVPEGHYSEDNMRATVVPNRNMIMLAMAAGIAVAEQAQLLAIGVHAGDHYVYPDCRPQFIDAMAAAIFWANQGFTAAGFHLTAPFVAESKADLVTLGEQLSVPWADTWSCYEGGERHCGRCGTCVERAEAFALAGVVDPTGYDDPDYWRGAVADHAG